jgi:hypothetical protein
MPISVPPLEVIQLAMASHHRVALLLCAAVLGALSLTLWWAGRRR